MDRPNILSLERKTELYTFLSRSKHYPIERAARPIQRPIVAGSFKLTPLARPGQLELRFRILTPKSSYALGLLISGEHFDLDEVREFVARLNEDPGISLVS